MSTRKTVEFRRSYWAVDKAGNRHKINVYVQVQHIETLDGHTHRVEGTESHKLDSDGTHVNVNSDGSVTAIHHNLTMQPVP